MQTAELSVSTDRRTCFVSIGSQVEALIRLQGWQDGVLTLFVPHTTAGITINENADPDVARDMEWFSDQLVPRSSRFRHAEGNSDAHLKASSTAHRYRSSCGAAGSGSVPGRGSTCANSTVPAAARSTRRSPELDFVVRGVAPTDFRSRMISRRRGLRLRGVPFGTLSCRRRANAERALIWNRYQTLKRKCMTSPSLTTYSFPSSLIKPFSLAPDSP